MPFVSGTLDSASGLPFFAHLRHQLILRNMILLLHQAVFYRYCSVCLLDFADPC